VLLDRPLPARVEYTMRVLARAFPRPGEPGLVDLRLSRRHVAQLVGGSRAAVGRALARLEAEGRLSVRDGRFAIHGAGEPLRFGPRPPLGTVLPPDREPPAARPTLRRLLNRLRPALGLDERSVERIVSMARLVRCAPGERVPAAPEGAYLSFVVDGAVRIVRETLPELWVHVARPGQFAGIGAEARDGRRLFRAEAHVPSTVAILGREAFAEVIGATMDEEGLLQFLAYASRVLSSYIRDQCLFLTMTGDERLLHALGVLAADFPRPDERGVVVDLRFTQRQLGRLVGMRREKVCGALVRLRRAGLVDVVEGCILLRGQHTGRAA
jgi:CRP-like cAMP-binding protein